MLDTLKRHWRELRDAPPGERFQRRHERRSRDLHARGKRIAWTIAAAVLIVVGLVAMPLPGPGFIPLAIGLAFLADISATVAKACDRAELAIRRLIGRRAAH